MQNMAPSFNLPSWKNEPYPDHSWISRTFKKIPLQYLDDILIRSAYLCLKESGWKKGVQIQNYFKIASWQLLSSYQKTVLCCYNKSE
ncbi:MAG: hypothetical protein ACRD5H_00705 [Nitrososphaerales archaeon]